jgi:Methyltransferase domain
MRTRGPSPEKMGVDTVLWAKVVNISNLINVYYEYRDAMSLPLVGKILLIGVTNGVEAAFLRSRGFVVTTFDIDATFAPDEVGSCDDLSRFTDARFDLVIASHVLEHLPVTRRDDALSEFARVARHALVYLPVAGRHIGIRCSLGTRRSFVIRLDLLRFWHKPSGIERIYRFNEHYWEIGYRGYRKRDVRAALSRHFSIRNEYRNLDWLPSYNFVLSSKAHT